MTELGSHEVSTQRMKLEALLEGRAVFSARPSEPGLFVLSVPPALINGMALHVGQPLEVEYSARRDGVGAIAEGRVLSFEVVTGDPHAFLDWLRDVGRAWENVECIPCELGRACAEHPEPKGEA